MLMEIHQLKYFHAVAEERSFTRAAKRLFVTQPNVSVQIRKLERELGVKLFDRSSGSITLSPAGQALHDCAKSVFQTIDDTVSKIGRLARCATQELRIAYIPSLGASVVSSLVAAVKDVLPDITLILHEIADSERIRRMLLDNELDVGVARSPHPQDAPASRTLFTEPFVVTSPTHGPLRTRDFTDLNVFAEVPFVIPSKGIGLRNQILDICHSIGFSPTVVLEAQGLDLLIGAVARGVGVSLLPRLCVDHRTGIAPIELSHPAATRTISLFWRPHAAVFRHHPRLAGCIGNSNFALPNAVPQTGGNVTACD